MLLGALLIAVGRGRLALQLEEPGGETASELIQHHGICAQGVRRALTLEHQRAVALARGGHGDLDVRG